MTARLPLLIALALAGGLSACGSHDQAAEQTRTAPVPTAGSGSPTPEPASTAPDTPAAATDTLAAGLRKN